MAELVGHPGASRRVGGVHELTDLVLEQTGTAADPDIDLDLEIATIVEGLTVTGVVHGQWHAPCRRCLEPVRGAIEASVSEIFHDEPTEAETWPIEAEHIDLEPLVRETVLLALPLSPLCGEQCTGPDPDRFPTTADPEPAPSEPDPRWAALDELRWD